MNARRAVSAAFLAVIGVLLAGCSQIAAIAPVGGSHLAEVRYAAIDLLVDAEVEILTAPVCAQARSRARARRSTGRRSLSSPPPMTKRC